VDKLSELTDADVAASDDLTGHSLLGGDWDLEYSHGVVEASPLLRDALSERYRHVLADPVLLVPGFGGTFAADTSSAGLDEWYTTRGAPPDSLQTDPLGNVYADIVRTLENVGYVQGETLFVANWDWRVPVAADDGIVDGQISGITAESITDGVYETGVDYLGYWLDQAADAWSASHAGEQLGSVDIIAHSTGGLVARSYVQSDAYGGAYDADGDGVANEFLPMVNDLVLAGMPNRGVATTWNLLHDDWNVNAASRLAARVVDHAYSRLLDGQTIQGPGADDITLADLPADEDLWKEAFVARYVASLPDLLPTFDFLDTNGDGVYESLNDTAHANTLLLDLNDGLDKDFTLEELNASAGHAVDLGGGDVREPNAFIANLTGELTVVYSDEIGTNDRALEMLGADPASLLSYDVMSFTEIVGHRPTEDEQWYQDVDSGAGGDGTVPTESAVGQFLGDPSAGLHLQPITEVAAGAPVEHTELVSDPVAQAAILNAVGASGHTQDDISTGLKNTRAQSLLVALDTGLIGPELLSDGLYDVFVSIGDTLGDGILARIPIVGDDLAGAVKTQFEQFGLDIRSAIDDALGSDQPGLISAIQDALYDALGPNGIDILLDSPDDGDDVTAADILFTGGDDNLEFDLHLGSVLVDLATEQFDFAAGLPGLGLELENAGLQFTVDWDFVLGIGLSLTDGFYINTADDSELELNVAGTLAQGASITGKLGFLRISASDSIDADDIVGANTLGTSGIFGQLAVDLRDPNSDGRLTYAEMRDDDTQLKDVVVGLGRAGVDVNLHATVDFGSGVFPSISTEFDLDWDFLAIDTSNYDPTAPEPWGDVLSSEDPALAFNDITLDLGAFISKFVSPILDQIGFVLDPIMPFIDVMVMELPVITELAELAGGLGIPVDLDADGEPGCSIYDLAAMIPDSRVAFILTVIDVIRVLDSLNSADDGGNIAINLGSFQVTGPGQDIRTGTSLEAFTPLNPVIEDTTAQLNDPSGGKNTKAFLKEAIGKAIQFPILTDPSQAFKLLLGQDADLFRLELPVLEFNFGFDSSFPIFPPFLVLGFEGNFSAGANIDFGFDTYGIRQFADSGEIEDIFNGFYLDDHGKQGSGVDLPEIWFHAGLSAKAGIDILIAEAGVSGGIFGDITFDLHDPIPIGQTQGDGKVRFTELADRFDIAPWAIFDMQGAVTYGVSAFVWVGLKIPLIFTTLRLTFYEDSFDIASGTLVDFNLSYPDAELKLAHVVAVGNEYWTADSAAGLNVGDLVLHSGPRAGLRCSDSSWNADNDESFTVSFLDATTSDPDEYLVVSALGATEAFLVTDVTGVVYAEGGEGDDRVSIRRDVFVPAVVYGDFADGSGNGSDVLKAGDGVATFYGGGGADELYGGTNNDILHGGGGNDVMAGKGGDDWLFGGMGHDRLRGEGGNDWLIGGEGLVGGVVIGDDGNIGLDQSDPDRPASDDFLDGGTGDDHLYGGLGDDRLMGRDGEDRLYGGAGSDSLLGHDDDDFLDGQDGLDVLEGGAAADIVRGGMGDDVVIWRPGEGDDTIDGQDGRDIMPIFGTARSEDVEITVEELNLDIVFEGFTLNATSIEQLSIDVGKGADEIVINDLGGSSEIEIALNLGTADDDSPDSSTDAVTIHGTALPDEYYLYVTNSGKRLVVDRAGGVVISIEGSDALSGDSLTVNGESGNDLIDARGSADPLSRGGVHDRLAWLYLQGGDQDDRLIGSVLTDGLDGGGGNDGLESVRGFGCVRPLDGRRRSGQYGPA